MVTISPTLRTTIERRSRRAWRRRASGSARKNHRISDITDDALLYRVPDSPDYYGKEKVKVVRKEDGTVLVDPPTTGLIDLRKKDDLKRIKKHAGEIKGYLVVRDDAAVAALGPHGGPIQIKGYEQAIEEIKDEHSRLITVESHANSVDNVFEGHITLSQLTVIEITDPVKDLGYDTKVIDCLTKADVVALRDLKYHLGVIRAYKYSTQDAKSPVQTPAITYKVGEKYEIKDADTDPASACHKGINVADAEWCKGKERVFVFEFKLEDIAAIPTNTDGKFRVHRCLCVEEVDPKTFKPVEPKKPKKGLMEKIFGSKNAEDYLAKDVDDEEDTEDDA